LKTSINTGKFELQISIECFIRKNDYKKLEIHHGYIQWLFPNFYSAGFNKDAFKLVANEARLFRENKEVKIPA